MKKYVSVILMVLLMLNGLSMPAFADVVEQGLPDVDAKAYVVIDESNHNVLISKNSSITMDMSNFSQVMTALLVIEEGTLTDNVTVGTIPEEYGNKVMLKNGEKVTLENLLKAIVVYSATDASVAAAEHVSGNTTKFVKLMNEKAQKLGMMNTNFVNVFGGSDDGQTTTAADMAILASYALDNEKYMNLATLESIVWQGDVRSNSVLENTNKFSSVMSNGLGIKMGDNRSGSYSLMAAVEKDGRKLTAVMLGCTSEDGMYKDMQTLLNFALNNTKVVPVIQKNSVMTQINYDEDKIVRVASGADYSLLLAKSNSAITGYNIILTDVELPIKKGEQVGCLEILVDNVIVDEVPLVALDDGKKPIDVLWLIVCAVALLYVVQCCLRFYRIMEREKKQKAKQENKVRRID